MTPITTYTVHKSFNPTGEEVSAMWGGTMIF